MKRRKMTPICWNTFKDAYARMIEVLKLRPPSTTRVPIRALSIYTDATFEVELAPKQMRWESQKSPQYKPFSFFRRIEYDILVGQISSTTALGFTH
jgi:hypothetical protein